MSIIQKKYDNGETELNKLKYIPNMGKSHPGQPPIITKKIPTEPSSDWKPTPISQVHHRADDLSRISQLFTRKEGLQLAANNTALNTAVAQSYTVTGTLADKVKALNDVNQGSALLNTLKTIGSTLAQVPVTGTGVHFIKGKLFGSIKPPFNNPTKTVANVGEPGKVSVRYGREQYYQDATAKYGRDRLGMIGPYTGTSKMVEGDVDDFIKFNFEVLKPGEGNNTFLHFRAYLDSFDDNFVGNWNTSKYVGRGEPFYTYESFNRTINISFKSAVMSKAELAPMYQRLAYLASTTAPTYSEKSEKNGTGGLMRGTIVRMTIGDYLADTPGYISSISYRWENRYPFEIARGKKDQSAPRDNSNTDLEVQELPHILDCNINFTPIHTFTPQTGMYHYITNPDETENRAMFREGVIRDRSKGETVHNNLPGEGSRGSTESGW